MCAYPPLPPLCGVTGKRDFGLAWVTFAFTVVSAPTLDKGLLASVLFAGVIFGLEKVGVLGPKAKAS